MTVRQLASIFLLLGLASSPSAGQNISVDENTFRIYVNGESVGTEEFSIRQTGPRAQQRHILRGTVELESPQGRVTLSPAMDASGTPLAVSDYQIKVSGAETTDIFIRVSGKRFLARSVSAAGEQLREFRAGPGSVLLDEGIVHHHFLLSPFLESEGAVSLTVFIPRAEAQQRMTLSLVGEEEVRVGGVLVSGARRFHLEGGEYSRDIWFDEQGRILRLEIPSRGYVAERENLG
jgi:hypothetical protein